MAFTDETYYTLKEYNDMYTECVEYKQPMISIYNAIYEFTSPFAVANTMDIRNSVTGRKINPAIYEASISFKNFVMYSLYGIETKWAKADVIEPLLRKKFKGDSLKKTIKKYKEKLEVQTEDIFSYIHDSNYKQEIGRAVQDWGELGTGCFELIEQDSEKSPFRFKYVAPNEYLFNEDSKGKPNIVFRKIFNKKVGTLKSIYPDADFSDKVLEQGDDAKITVMECVSVKYGSNGSESYEWLLVDEQISEIYDREVFDYNPYTIFRFSIIPNTCWGIGIGIMALDAYERLVFYENLRARQALRICDPPTAFTGDKRLMDDLDLEPNGFNYLGDGRIAIGNVYPINTTGTLMPLDTDIDRITQTIQSLHFNNPFGNADNRTTRAVNEIQYRMSLLQQKFDDAVSNLFSEVLMPSFYKPKKILEYKDLIEVIEEDKYFKPKFVNTLTKTMDAQKIESLISYQGVMQQLLPQKAPFLLKKEDTPTYVAENMGVDLELLNDSETVDAEQEQALQSALQAQRIAGLGGEQGGEEQEIE